MPDASKRFGLAEAELADFKVGEHCQFEKFGYVRLDSKGEKGLVCWFSHE